MHGMHAVAWFSFPSFVLYFEAVESVHVRWFLFVHAEAETNELELPCFDSLTHWFMGNALIKFLIFHSSLWLFNFKDHSVKLFSIVL